MALGLSASQIPLCGKPRLGPLEMLREVFVVEAAGIEPAIDSGYKVPSPNPYRQPSCAFSSSAADFRSSRESFSSFTARAIDTAPTRVARAVIAFARRDLRLSVAMSFAS